MRVITIVNQVGVTEIIGILRKGYTQFSFALERNPELREGDDDMEENPEEGPSVVPCSRPEDTRDPLNKIGNVFNALTLAFKRSFIPYKDLCVDEFLMLWKG
ncbi:hypothetical protein SKAU_G00249900 [Synaphobranchus kaupii]|uniref:Uncharacterized protein n=1 Tax=Synaphobranchus kaupii TaxID=118154 RepID=A0A9Q1F2M2_SYNKA|nr:hypothetical protein SKAU_G00249900 [Synaphobranchus kaupii]